MHKVNRQLYIMDNITVSEEQEHSSQKRKAQQHRRSKSIMVDSSASLNSPGGKRKNEFLLMGRKSALETSTITAGFKQQKNKLLSLKNRLNYIKKFLF
jgi:hypothetical protein